MAHRLQRYLIVVLRLTYKQVSDEGGHSALHNGPLVGDYS